MKQHYRTANPSIRAALPQALLRKYAAGFFAGVGPNTAKTIGHYATEALGRQATAAQNSTGWFSGLKSYFNRGAKPGAPAAAPNIYSNMGHANFGMSPATNFIGDVSSSAVRPSPPAASMNISPVSRFTVHNTPSYGATPNNGFTTTFSTGVNPSITGGGNVTGQTAAPSQRAGVWDRIKDFFGDAAAAGDGIVDDSLDDSFWAARKPPTATRTPQSSPQLPNFGEWWNGLLNTRIGHNATIGDYPLAVAAGGLYLGGRGLDIVGNAIGGAPQPYYPQPYYPQY